MITLKNKIGQMLIMGFNGCELHEHTPIAQWLSGEGLGGVLLFDKDYNTGLYGKNLRNQSQIKTLIKQLNYYSDTHSSNTNDLPLLVGVDYEGGAVDRFTKVEGCMSTLTAVELAQLSPAALEEELCQMAGMLSDLGFNLNFAPVVDLDLNNLQGIIGKLKRSFSSSPETTAKVAAHFVKIFNQYGIVCSYKHFPGHGSAVGDTHEGFVDVTETFNFQELKPYELLLKDHFQSFMIMTAHVVNKNLDDSGLPATLSYKILTELLRNKLHYDGVIVSDDLQMQAISTHYSLEDSLCLTINAGADMVIFGNQLDSITAPKVIECIEQLVFDKHIEQSRIDDAYRRIVRLKYSIFSRNTADQQAN